MSKNSSFQQYDEERTLPRDSKRTPRAKAQTKARKQARRAKQVMRGER